MAHPDNTDLVNWARNQAERIRNSLADIGLAAQTIDFLKRWAGEDSSFHSAARKHGEILIMYPESEGADRAKLPLAAVLESWADYYESGLATAPPFGLAARSEAAGDLVDQASQLLGEKDHTPAAAAMLAGAALEEFLRGLWVTTTEKLAGKQGIVAYAQALRKAGLVDANDVKELTAMAGVRNDAAHGDFDKIDEARSKLYLQQVAFFLQKHRP